MANEYVYEQAASTDSFIQDDFGELTGNFAVGNEAAPATNIDGAVRFPSVTIAQGVTVYSAQLKMYAAYSGGGTIRYQCYGIKETNTAAFTSNPFGRTRTTANNTGSSSPPSVGSYLNIDVTNQVNEILAQGGWSSGNAMGFHVLNNASDNPAYVDDDTLSSLLVIKLSVDPDFFPDPGSIAAPTFPATTHIGWI